MSGSNEKLSVPRSRKTLPRDVTDSESVTLARLADVLCAPTKRALPPSEQPDFKNWVHVALAARSDSFNLVMDLVAEAGIERDPSTWLRALHDRRGTAFQVLSTVLAGAYLMIPDVRHAIGYPGQHRDLPAIDEAADDLADGILDPVIQRGRFFVPTPEAP